MLLFFCAFLADMVVALAGPVLALSCGRCWRARTASVGAAVVAALLRLVLALSCGHCWSCYQRRYQRQRCGTHVADTVDVGVAARVPPVLHSCVASVNIVPLSELSFGLLPVLALSCGLGQFVVLPTVRFLCDAVDIVAFGCQCYHSCAAIVVARLRQVLQSTCG